jgi:phage terminase large subunit-like protein
MVKIENLEKDKARAEQAQALLRNEINEILQEAFTYLEEQYHIAWANSSLDQKDPREKVFMMLTTLKAVKQHIENVVTDGKLADDTLNQL